MTEESERDADGPAKPELHLLRGGPDLTLEDLAAFCEALTGRRRTAAEREEAHRILVEGW